MQRVPAVATAATLTALGLLAALAFSPTHQRAGLGAPSSSGLIAEAGAHRVAGGTVECVITEGAVKIRAAANLVDFSSSDQPVSGTLYVDSAPHAIAPVTFSGSSYTLVAWRDTTPGHHHVAMSLDWPGRGDQPHTVYGDVTCPALPTPTPTPTPTPPPPCTTCSLVPPPPVTPPTPPSTKTVRKHVAITTRVNNPDPFVAAPARAHRHYWLTTSWNPRRPRGAVHAPTWVTFHVRGPHDLSGVRRWFIDGHRLHASRWVTLRNRSATVALFDLEAWAPDMGTGLSAWGQLQGWHRVTYTAHRKVVVKA